MKRKLHIVVALGVLAIFTFTPQMQAAERSMVLSGSGGYVAEMSKTIWETPFTAATGIKIKHVSSENQRMAQLEAMVRSGKSLWDVTEVSATNYPMGVQKNLFEPIDYSQADPDNLLPDIAKLKYGVGVAAYSVVLVVRKDKLPKGKMMKSWADFWNFKEFPGPRSLNGRPQDNFEFALLADGVDPKDLYKVLSTPEGIQRAFDKLEELKPHVSSWWMSGAQSVQLLSDGEVFYCTTYNGRVSKLVESGVPAEIVWNGGSLHMSYLGIPKGEKISRKPMNTSGSARPTRRRCGNTSKRFPIPVLHRACMMTCPQVLANRCQPTRQTWRCNSRPTKNSGPSIWITRRTLE